MTHCLPLSAAHPCHGTLAYFQAPMKIDQIGHTSLIQSGTYSSASNGLEATSVCQGVGLLVN